LSESNSFDRINFRILGFTSGNFTDLWCSCWGDRM